MTNPVQPRNSRDGQVNRSGQQDSTVVSSMRQSKLNSTMAKGRSRSKRTIINFWLDACLLVLFVMLGTTAVIVQFVFPPGVAARGWTLWGMTYGQWCSVQFGILCAFSLAVLVHVMLHWTWICGVISRRLLGLSQLPDDGTRTLFGVSLLIVLLSLAGLILAIAHSQIVSPPDI